MDAHTRQKQEQGEPMTNIQRKSIQVADHEDMSANTSKTHSAQAAPRADRSRLDWLGRNRLFAKGIRSVWPGWVRFGCGVELKGARVDFLK